MISTRKYRQLALNSINPFEIINDNSNYPNGTPYPYICQKRFIWIINQLEQLISQETYKSILSIGCYPGSLDRILKLIYGDRILISGVGLAMNDEFKKSLLGSVYKELHSVELDPFFPGNLSEIYPNSIPLADSSVDIVIAGEIFEHLYSPLHMINEISRVLKPGGHLIITTPNISYFGNIIKLLRGESCHETLKTSHIFMNSEWRAHIRVYDPNELRFLFSQCGLKESKLDIIDNGEDAYYMNTLTKLKMLAIKMFYIIPRYRNNICQIFEKIS